ncbi:hypothetical protein BH09ACT5_BH09ACT5_08490 [soil metagenome]
MTDRMPTPARTDRPVRAGVRAALDYLKAIMGENAYDDYLAHHATHGAGQPMGRAEFWKQRSDDQDANPGMRCC